MAAVNSSSKRKSSSSHKKKSRKISSEVKRSRNREKNTSKKLRRSDASFSYSDDDSRSRDSVSISSSDSEDNYNRSRRARSRTRRDKKGSKKRVRRSSTSPEDSRDSPHRRKKKESKRKDRSKDSRKKGSNRKDVFLPRKKAHKKKRSDVRSRRDKSVGSVSSDSRSCSTCQKGGGSSCEEREFERSRAEGKAKKAKRSSGKTSYGRQNYRYRSRSCSSFSDRSNERGSCGEERFSRENYSRRRIRSVSAEESHEAEGRDYYKVERRAEIIQDFDDYPSSRSNDSYEGGKKKDFSHNVHVEKKRKIDDLNIEEAFISDTRTTEFTKSSNEDPTKFEASIAIDSSEGKVLESVLRQKALEKFEASSRIDSSEGNDMELFLRQKALEKFEASTGNDSLLGNDLESILRQKALANLKKFHGGLHMNVKAPGAQSHKSDNGVEQPSTAKADTTETDFPKEAGRVAVSKEVVSQDMKNVGMSSTERKPATSKDDGLILDKNQNQHESTGKLNVARIVLGAGNSSSGEMVAGKATEKNSTDIGVITNKATQDTSDPSSVNQKPTTEESPTSKLIEPKTVVEKNIVEKNVTEIPKTANGCSNTHVAEISNECESATEASSCVPPVIGEHANEQGGVAKGSSQFEQKTMSVMRGGEMVQVSYKVYIPQKPPALARRKLQR